MRKRILIIVIVVVAIVIGASFVVYVTSPSWLPRSTSVTVSGQSQIESATKILFTATVKSGSTQVSSGTVSWSVSAGSLNTQTGLTVVYTAPTVTSNTSVTITASFGGSGVYQASSTTAHATIYTTQPNTGTTTSTSTTGTATTTTTSTSSITSTVCTASSTSIVPCLYTISFEEANFTNLSFSGPISMNGTSVTMISASSANVAGLNISRFGLTASEMTVSDLTLYTTYAKFSTSSGGAATVINGTQNIDQEPIATANYTNCTFYLARMGGSDASFSNVVSVGQYVGGSEPYVPSIITGPTVGMTNSYSVTGPTSWEDLNDMVSNVTTGGLTLSQFAMVHPVSYSINMQAKTYNATGMWSLSASDATATNVKAFTVYFSATGGEGVTVTAFGDQNPNNLIPFDLNVGSTFTGSNMAVQPVYFAAQQLSLGSLLLSIE